MIEKMKRLIRRWTPSGQRTGSTLVPLGTKLKRGTVTGVHFMNGERYYFLDGRWGSVDLIPADIVEKEYQSND